MISKTIVPGLIAVGAMLAFTGCTTTSVPDVTHEGLVRVKSRNADIVYVLPGADLSRYNRVVLLQPQISFRSGWQSDVNSGRSLRRITDDDVEKMIEFGKQLLIEEFAKALQKGGYEVVTERAPDVLAVKPAIIDLDIYAPDPDNMSGIWSETYSNGSGEATLYLELYDSVTEQLLVRAIDTKTNRNDGFSWRFQRTQASNIMDARVAFSDWARSLVRGLDGAKQEKAEAAASGGES